MNRLLQYAVLSVGCACTDTLSAAASEPGYSLERIGLIDPQFREGVVLRTADPELPVVAAFSGDGLRFYRRTAEGEYLASGLTPFGSGFLSSVSAEDLNGDGLDDLCFGYGGDVVALYVLLQTESGDFAHAPKSPLPTPFRTRDVTVWDMDGDGDRDIVVCGDNFVDRYENLGDGVFVYPRPLGVDGLVGGVYLAAGEANAGPNRLAVVRTPNGVTEMSMVPAASDGGLSVEQVVAMQGGGHTFRLADFEGDGDQDIVVIGRAGGTFAQVATFGSSGYTVYPLTLVPDASGNFGAFIDDIDGDGILDAVASNSRGLCVMYGTVADGTPGFEPPVILGLPNASIGPAYDVTGDGLKDLFLGGVRVYENDGGRFRDTNYRQLIGTNASARQAVYAPWSEPDRPVLLVNDINQARLRRFEFDYSDTELFVESSLDPAVASGGVAYVFADIDADGIEDLVVVSDSTSGQPIVLTYHIGLGEGAFLPVVNMPNVGFSVRGLSVCDLNGDGADDVVMFGTNAGDSAVYAGVPGAGMQLAGGLGVSGQIQQIGTGDFDGDGMDDVAVFVQQDIIVRYGGPDGLSGDEGRIDLPWGVLASDLDRLAGVDDLDGDGLDDIAYFGRYGSSPESGIPIYFSLPGRRFERGEPAALSIGDPRAIRIRDLNGDGRNEIVAFEGSTTKVLASDANGMFREVDEAPVGTSDGMIPLLLDMNADGLVDLVDVTRSSITVHYAVRGRPCVGDVDLNGIIDWFDIAAWLADLQSGSIRGDLDGNGAVNYFDLVLILRGLSVGCD